MKDVCYSLIKKILSIREYLSKNKQIENKSKEMMIDWTFLSLLHYYTIVKDLCVGLKNKKNPVGFLYKS